MKFERDDGGCAATAGVKRFACPTLECGVEADVAGSCAKCGEALEERVHELWLPQTFWMDHAERSLPAGDVVRWRGHRGLIRCSDSELREIGGDARHYSDPNGPDAEWLGGLKASARATVRAIEAYRAAAPAAPRARPRSALGKSVQTYRAMLARLPRLSAGESVAVRLEVAEYLRSLYLEFGREAVRKEIANG